MAINFKIDVITIKNFWFFLPTMAKALLIAEKPSLRRTIESVYNRNRSLFADDITFAEQRGHLVTLKLPSEVEPNLPRDWSSLPFHPEEHGGWQYKVIQEKKVGNYLTAQERFDIIKNELQSGVYDYIIHAGDPEQEGQLLIELVLRFIGNKLPVKRFWSNATTDSEVIHALQNLRDCATDPQLIHLLDAAYARQHSDYRFGMNLSSAASLKMNGRAAIGRVKTPILAIVCQRENAIRNYVPCTTYGIKAVYSNGVEGILCEESEESENGKAIIFDAEAEAKSFIATLSNKATVISFTEKNEKSYAPKLYKLSKAQLEADKMGYNANEVLDIIQSLYDKGYLSYPRTGCDLLSSTEDLRAFLNSASVIPELAPYASAISDSTIEAIKKNKRYVDDVAIQQEGHTALRPTEKAVNLSDLTKAEKDIYTMICTRFVSIFLPPLVQKKIKLLTDIEGNLFVSNGKELIDPGYTVLYGTNFSNVPIPAQMAGDVLDVSAYDTTQHNSTCPSRFTSGELADLCESPAKYLDDMSLKSLGKRLRIGTDATRTQIIQTLIEKDHYLEIKKSKNKEYLVPTAMGEEIINNLGDCAITKVDMSGHWEERLQEVRLGNLSLDDLEQEMRLEVERLIDEIRNKPMTPLSTGYGSNTIGICPLCGGNVISGKKSFFCSAYKEKGCSFGFVKKLLGATISDNEGKKLMSGEVIVKKLTKDGRTWEQKLRLNDAHELEFVKEQRVATAYTCPSCGGTMMENDKNLICSNFNMDDESACHFYIPKDICGYHLKEKDLKLLFENGRTEVISGFVSKSKKKFDAALKMEDGKVEFDFPKPQKSGLQCPVCGKELLDTSYGYVCEDHNKDGSGCKFSGIPKQLCQKSIDKNLAKKLLTGKKTEILTGFKSKKGKSFSAALILSDGELSFDFGQSASTSASRPSSYTCPCCGLGMTENNLSVSCSCGFALWKKVAGKQLSETEIKEILTNGSTSGPVFGFKSKKGKAFHARLYVDKKEKNVSFDFGE